MRCAIVGCEGFCSRRLFVKLHAHNDLQRLPKFASVRGEGIQKWVNGRCLFKTKEKFASGIFWGRILV